MRTSTHTLVASAFAAILALGMSTGGNHVSLVTTASAQTPPAGCTFPTAEAATPEQTAWQIFTAANCTAGNGKLVWENWIEQEDLYPASGVAAPTGVHGAAMMQTASPVRFHRSVLAVALHKAPPSAALLAPNTDCGKMNGPPPNVIAGAQICEEVHINPSFANFLTANKYQVRSGQMLAAINGTNIQFPTDAVEVKVDWIPASDFTQPFSCTTPPSGIHVEMIAGTCYAMAGMHILSKLLPNWVWATFEPQSLQTNPLRCITFGPCSDAWGSVPATSSGASPAGNGFTNQTPAVQALMASANLAPEFSNYRMDGAQVDFTTSNGSPTYLGNSVIEGENVGMTFNTASCISCHAVSTIAREGTDGLSFLAAGVPIVGPQFQPPPGWIARDFVWSMNQACPNVFGRVTPCTAPPKAAVMVKAKPKAKAKK